jgi:hypothetical protein
MLVLSFDFCIIGRFILAPHIIATYIGIVDVIIPSNIVCVLFGPVIPTSSFDIVVAVPFLLPSGQNRIPFLSITV